MKKLLLSLLVPVLFSASVFSQNVGIGTNTPVSKLDINGAISLREGQAISNLVNGNNDNLTLPDISGSTSVKASFYRITTGALTADFNILGIVPNAGADGQVVTLVNTTGFLMTIKNNTSSTPANGFKTLTGSDMVSVAGNSSVTIQYNKADQRWYVTGSQNFGAQGATGATGSTGAQGPAGPTGATGTQGTAGAAGATGPQGPTGSQGAVGATGNTGSQGPAGATGAAGAQGPAGSAGANGADGKNAYTTTTASYTQPVVGNSVSVSVVNTGWMLTGQSVFVGGSGGYYVVTNVTNSTTVQLTYIGGGSSGTVGTAGSGVSPSGQTGQTGATGAQGSQGIQGVQGVAGATGSQGIQGVAGATGAQGIQGVAGATGAQGIQGVAGATGAQGIAGPTGAQGATGLLSAGTATGNTTYWDGTQWVLSSGNMYNNGGNVGIGTTSPGSKLSVVAPSGGFSASFNGGNAAGVIPAVNSGITHSQNFSNGLAEEDIWNNFDPATFTGTGIRFLQRLTASTTRDLMFLSNTGNVGIGTTSPAQKLDINGNSITRGIHYQITSAGQGSGAHGISWYDPSYVTWFDYMAPAGGTNSPNGTASPSDVTSGVTSWARRFNTENAAGYGWVFESGLNNATAPTVKFSVNANNGNFHAIGNGYIDGTLTIAGGSPGAGKVLVSDAAGLASWGAAGSVAASYASLTNIPTRTTWNSTNPHRGFVAEQLSWKNYGDNHTIFDASASTSPTGVAISNTNAAIAWTATYPTLMGWNGTSTYGVRVDAARVADNATTTTAVAGTTNYVSKFTSATTIGVSQIFDNGTNVGVGTASPTYKFQIQKTSVAAPALMIGGAFYGGPRIQTYGLDADPNAWMGLGTDMGVGAYEHSIYYSAVASSKLTFGTYDGTTYTTKAMLLNNGNFGLGTTAPVSKLHISGGAPTGLGGLPAGTVAVVENGAANNYLTFRNTADNGTYQGLQFQDNNVGGYIAFRNYVGSGANDGTNGDYLLYGTYTDHVFQTGASEAVNGKTEVMRIKQSGSVGIGTASPAEKLDVAGNIKATGKVYWGNGLIRTETRTDAGLQGNAGAMSGFYENDGTTVTNYPTGASGWWHLLDVRHSNPANNYAMQFAGSFFDQNLYFRKTNNSASTAWSRVMTSSDVSGTTNYISKFTSANTIGNSLLFDDGTNVGLGTTTMGAKLSVSAGSGSATAYRDIELRGAFASGEDHTITTRDAAGIVGSISMGYNGVGIMKFGDLYYAGYHPNTPLMTLIASSASTGNLGLGTTAPTDNLFIAGTNNVGADVLNNDGNDRPGLSIRGNYPELNIISSVGNNTNHGATLRFVAYDDVNRTAWKHWVVGVPGQNAANLDFGYAANASNPHQGIAGWSGTTVMRMSNNGNVGIGNFGALGPLTTTSPASTLHVMGKINLHQSGTGGGQNRFEGLDGVTSANGRAQFVMSSAYSDLVIASSQANDNHGSTLTFATYNPSDATDYRKFVINQGNWGARRGFLDFGFADAGGRSNPHSNINGGDAVLSLDGFNKRLGIGTMSPAAKVEINNTSAIPALSIGDNGTDNAAGYGMVNLTRPADLTRAHLAFIRTGNYVWQMGYVQNSNTFGIFPWNLTGGGTPAMAFTTGGSVGIGITAPNAILHTSNARPNSNANANVQVNETTSGTYPSISLTNSGAGTGTWLLGNTGNNGLNIGVFSNAAWSSCNASGFNVNSDRRLKKEITTLGSSDFDSYMAQIRNIESATYRYNWEDNTSREYPHLGFIAQTLPNTVTTKMTEKADGTGIETIGYSLSDMIGLSVMGIKAIDNKQQQTEQLIKEYQTQMEQLKSGTQQAVSSSLNNKTEMDELKSQNRMLQEQLNTIKTQLEELKKNK